MTGSDPLAPALAAFQRGDLHQAQAIAERVAGAAGGSTATADHLLGLIHCRLGDFSRGIDHLRRALAADPGNAATRVMLGRALVDADRGAEVLEMPPPPRDGRPESLASWSVRAEAAQALGDWPAAVQAWHAVAGARPGDWRAQASLGNAQAAAENWGEAAAALGRAAALNPTDPAIRSNLAAALERFGEIDSAIEEMHAALQLDPQSPAIHLALAQLLGRSERQQEALELLDRAAATFGGQADIQIERARALVALMRFDEAEQQYREILAGEASHEAAIHELGLLLERTGRLDSVRDLLDAPATSSAGAFGYLRAVIALRDGDAEAADRLLQTEPADCDPVRWHRLRARIADALGDPALAFASGQAMNAAVPDFEAWRERGAAYRQRTRDLARQISAQWAAGLPQAPPSSRRTPAFLVGFPRSGTTLLDTFLMGHPDTVVLEEVHMLGAAEQVIGTAADLADATPPLLASARDSYFAELDRHVDPAFEGLVVDKLPLNMLGLPLIRALFPDARIIFSQRHPCDAVLSGFMQSFVLNDAMACFLDISDAADLYDAAMEVWARSAGAIPLPVHTLVYESLVVDPEASLKPLMEFLGLEWRAELLDHRGTARRRGAILTPSYDQVTQPLSKGPSGRWRRYEKQLAPVLQVLLPWAERLGYPS